MNLSTTNMSDFSLCLQTTTSPLQTALRFPRLHPVWTSGSSTVTRCLSLCGTAQQRQCPTFWHWQMLILKSDFYPRTWRKLGSLSSRNVFNANQTAHMHQCRLTNDCHCVTLHVNCESPLNQKFPVCRFRRNLVETTTKKNKCRSNKD